MRQDIDGDQIIGKALTPAGEVWVPKWHTASSYAAHRPFGWDRVEPTSCPGLLHRPVVAVCTAVLMLEWAGVVAPGD